MDPSRIARAGIAGYFLWCGGPAHAEPPRPDCTLERLGEPGEVRLEALRGRVVVVDFWTSWCSSCPASFAFLDGLERELSGRDFAVVAVNLDEDPADAARFLARHPASFVVAAGADAACAREFGVTAMPTAFLLDRAGRVRATHVGFRAQDAGELSAAVLALLDEPDSAAAAAPGPPPGPAAPDAIAKRAPVEPWERGRFAKPHMALDPHPALRALRDHVYMSREAASGGESGGTVGCGCY